ncbi:co-chaperone DjlA [Halioxenophilus sp. WMMB6]|uniref:co-chaperone DjlA n=1 Tax=Halioxenophilus sp. WMMB6 TaxID=3073815 RepID=UPI00295E4EB5|nr:co-chaperone DjlA [Halioxenophilus sp. WMMB6]
MWFGKLIGALLGLMVLGPLGLLIGLAVGHMFDRSLKQFRPALSPAERAEAEQIFFETVFRLMGYVAKADGRVSEEEIAAAEQFMAQMRLHPEHRKQAIEHFKAGSSADFDLIAQAGRFNAIGDKLPSLRQTVLTYLINMALADGRLDPAEEVCLAKIAEHLGIATFVFKQLLAMIRAQANFHQSYQSHQQQYAGGAQPSSANELALAYEALGVEASASDAVVKKAYRKLMSENHPDKLMGQGVPQDMIDMATERAKDIQAAYDLIKKQRAAAGNS